jgi:hypothetical protein
MWCSVARQGTDLTEYVRREITRGYSAAWLEITAALGALVEIAVAMMMVAMAARAALNRAVGNRSPNWMIWFARAKSNSAF